MYQDYVANKAKEKATQLEQYYNQVLSKVQAELKCILCKQFVKKTFHMYPSKLNQRYKFTSMKLYRITTIAGAQP